MSTGGAGSRREIYGASGWSACICPRGRRSQDSREYGCCYLIFIYFYIGTLQKGACKQQLRRPPGTRGNMLLSHFYFFQAQKGACNLYLWRLKASPPSIKNYKKKANRDHRKTKPTKKKTREENNCIYSLLRAVYTRDAKSR